MNYSTCVDFKICLRTGKVNRLLEKRAPPPKYFIFFVDNKKLTLLYNALLAISSDLENLKLKKKSIKRFSFRFHDNSDVIVTLIITNFHLYLIQLWCYFLHHPCDSYVRKTKLIPLLLWGVYVVVQFYPRFKFYFRLFLGHGNVR